MRNLTILLYTWCSVQDCPFKARGAQMNCRIHEKTLDEEDEREKKEYILYDGTRTPTEDLC